MIGYSSTFFYDHDVVFDCGSKGSFGKQSIMRFCCLLTELPNLADIDIMKKKFEKIHVLLKILSFEMDLGSG